MNKLGFSTGKGFLETVDKADKAETTDFTNQSFIEGKVGETYLAEGEYEIGWKNDNDEFCYIGIVNLNGTSTQRISNSWISSYSDSTLAFSELTIHLNFLYAYSNYHVVNYCKAVTKSFTTSGALGSILKDYDVFYYRKLR